MPRDSERSETRRFFGDRAHDDRSDVRSWDARARLRDSRNVL
jgi:hypothetical protein